MKKRDSLGKKRSLGASLRSKEGREHSIGASHFIRQHGISLQSLEYRTFGIGIGTVQNCHFGRISAGCKLWGHESVQREAESLKARGLLHEELGNWTPKEYFMFLGSNILYQEVMNGNHQCHTRNRLWLIKACFKFEPRARPREPNLLVKTHCMKTNMAFLSTECASF